MDQDMKDRIVKAFEELNIALSYASTGEAFDIYCELDTCWIEEFIACVNNFTHPHSQQRGK